MANQLDTGWRKAFMSVCHFVKGWISTVKMITNFASISSSIEWGKYFLFPREIAMADVYPVPCDQVPRPLPTPGTDVDIRNKRKTKTPVIALGLPGCVAPFLGSLFTSRYSERPDWKSSLPWLWKAAETFHHGSWWLLLPKPFLWFQRTQSCLRTWDHLIGS